MKCYFAGISIGLFFIALGFFSCSKKVITQPEIAQPPADTTQVDVPEIVVPDDGDPPPVLLLTSLKRTACFGQCPVFEYKFFSDGRAVYLGRQHTPRLGSYEAYPDAGFTNKIKALADQVNFFRMADHYPEQGPDISDLPNTITTILGEGGPKTVVNNHRAPVSLRQFEKELENLFANLEWRKIQVNH